MSITTIRKILGGRALYSVSPQETVRRAAETMAANNVGALAVVETGNLAGVLSERDIVFRCVAKGASPDDTAVADVMTRDPVTLDIEESISDALAAKLGDAFRHLPVMEGGRVVGLLSYRDIPAEYLMMYERFREMSSAHADDAP